MNTLLLAALAAVSAPSDADMLAMFDNGEAFVRVCQPALEGINDPKQSARQEGAATACVSFVAGIGYAKSAADNYTVKGESVCSGPATPRQVMEAAFRLYNEAPNGKALTTTELILAGQAVASPCR